MKKIKRNIETPLENLNIYLTWECNLRCIHCWVKGDNNNKSPVQFSKRNIKDLIMQALEMGLKHIKFTGGEPLLKFDLIKYITESFENYNLKFSIETNGTFINENIADFFYEHEFSVSVSLNGFNEKTNEEFVRVDDAFDDTLQGIKTLQSKKINNPVVVTSIYRDNLMNLEKFLDFCLSLGITEIKINPITSMGRGSSLASKAKLLSPKEHLLLANKVNKYQKENNCKIFLHEPICIRSYSNIRTSGLSRCKINNMLSILPNGSISICGYGGINKDIIIDQVKNGLNLVKLWEENPLLEKIRSINSERLKGVCNKCIHKKLCLGDCRVLSYHEYNRWDMPMPLCQKLWEEDDFPETRII